MVSCSIGDLGEDRGGILKNMTKKSVLDVFAPKWYSVVLLQVPYLIDRADRTNSIAPCRGYRHGMRRVHLRCTGVRVVLDAAFIFSIFPTAFMPPSFLNPYHFLLRTRSRMTRVVQVRLRLPLGGFCGTEHMLQALSRIGFIISRGRGPYSIAS